MYGILADVTKCTACEKCVVACTLRHGLELLQADQDRAVTPDGLSAHRLLTILEVGQGRFARKSCMHCLEASCVAACMVGALTKTAEGPVIYNQEKCIGCRYCMLACPFHVPRYQWGRTSPYIVKCDMCYDWVSRNELPACVEACPEKALQFGDRKQLLDEAHAQIRRFPSRYQRHIWGENEFGGTSVMYISDVNLTALGWPRGGAVAIPSLTEPLVHKTPFIGLSVACGLFGLNWIVKRRNELASNTEREAKRGEDDHE